MRPFRLIGTLCLLLSLLSAFGQNKLDFQVFNDDVLPAPWAGGLNACQFGRMDVDGDGKKDLLVFDRHGNRLSCFLNQGNTGEIHYVFDNTYAKHFPRLTDWVVFADYDGDGREDIFTYSKGWAGMKVYRNVSAEQIEFELVVSPYLTSWQGGGEVNLLATNADYPAIVDLDGDGDFDILTFGVLGTFIEKHRNLSVERFGHRDSLVFEKTESCWGRVAESEENNAMYLDTCLFGKSLVVSDDFRHRGATLAVRDLTGNSLPDLLLADVDYPNLVLLKNGGTPENAMMVSQETDFPENAPINLFSMPVPFFTDIDNDGVDDMLVSPFDPNPMSCEGQNSVWLYLNKGTNQHPDFQLYTKAFLQDQMIDVGTGAYPVFVDVDGDGLTDLVIGSIGNMDTSYYNNGVLQTHRTARLALYKNVGTRQKPVFQIHDNDFGGLSTLRTMGLVPTFGDLNGDGRLEMLVGTAEGRLLYYDADFNLVDDDFLHFEKPWSAPCLFDVDSDGVLDLVVGDESGKLSYYQGFSQGSETQFSFVTDNWGGADVCDHTVSYFGYSVPTLFRKGDEVMLAVGSEQGKVFLFKDLCGAFTDVSNRWDEYVCDFENCFGLRSAAALADLNADGYLEMVVGNFGGGLELLNGDIAVNQDIEENGPSTGSGTFVVYPNPARGIVTVEGKGWLTVSNLLGQTILAREIDGRATITLPHGFWLVRLNGFPKKVIVE